MQVQLIGGAGNVEPAFLRRLPLVFAVLWVPARASLGRDDKVVRRQGPTAGKS